MDHKTEAIYGPPGLFSRPAVLSFKAVYLPISLELEVELVAQVGGNGPDGGVEFLLVAGEKKHIIHIAEVVIRLEVLGDVVIQRGQ